MKVEVRCPNCDKGYLVDEQEGPGEFVCPGCFQAIRTPERAMVAAVAGAPAAPMNATGGAGSAPSQTGGSSAAAEVICPRCNLHFSPRKAAGETQSTARPKVLIVEDMRYFQEIAHEALSNEYEVIPATTAAEALAKLAEGGIQLMVLDLTLDGEAGGVNLLHGLTCKPCPILIFTAQDESEMYGAAWDELRKLGADDMVLKGMNVGESLARKVGALLGKPWDEED